MYVLEMLPYPSGELHMGHVKNYTMGDVVTLVRRRNGWRVMHPMGYDAFGLPAENAAIKSGQHPAVSTRENIAAIRKQMKRMGWSIDWTREVSTCEPEYYKWTQWIFLRLFEAGLAYRREAPVKWCPVDQTVLANEQVIDGHCERCGSLVEAKNLEQWFFKITDYAQRLLDDLQTVNWPERVVTMQRNWIGRSEGAEVVFRVEHDPSVELPVFTTRPDTLFGATFFVLAPEHPLAIELARGTEYEAAVVDYVRRTAALSEVERAEEKQKTGVFTGRSVVNPVNGEAISVWVADYVLMEYGTGAIMAVPAHDERDHEFATAYDLPIRQVVAPRDGDGGSGEREAFIAHSADEVLVNSGDFSGLSSPDGKAAIIAWLEERSLGHGRIAFRLRDWLLSRQRYWGCPIPVVHCADSDHLSIRHLFGVSMIDGIRLAATSAQDRNPTTGILCDGIAAGHPGHFTATTITDECIVSGTNAEQNYGSDLYHSDPPRTTSENVISNVSTAGTDVTIAGIGYDQSAAPFSLGAGSPVDAAVPCSASIARSGWPGLSPRRHRFGADPLRVGR